MNYRRTAEILNMTQPGVTQHIQFLEKHYGVRLFIYDGKQLTRTEHAEALKRHIDSVHTRERTLWEGFSRRAGIHLEVGATKTIGEYVIRRQIEQILDMPGYSLNLEIDNTVNILRHIDEGSLDFALVEGYFDRNAYGHRLYRKEPFVGFCATEHPFADRQVNLHELWNENILVREDGSGTRSILEKMLEGENRSLKDFKTVNSISNFGLLEHLVSRSKGITFAYRAVGEDNPALAEFKVEGWDIAREFNYVYLSDSGAERDVDFFESLK
jgi:DNA-binding transcriptional LysR family regulator